MLPRHLPNTQERVKDNLQNPRDNNVFDDRMNPPLVDDIDKELIKKRDEVIKSLDVEHEIPSDIDDELDLDHAPPKKQYPNEVSGDRPHHASQGDNPLTVPVLPNQRRYKGELFPIFETPMFKGIIDGINRDEVIKDIRELTRVVAETHPRADECYTTYFSKKARAMMYDTQWFKDFEMNMKQTYREYMEHVWDDYIADDEHVHFFAWANRYQGRNNHNYHIHNGSFISGTWYVKSDEGHDQPIKFVNPQSQMAMKMNELDFRKNTIEFDNPDLGQNEVCMLGSSGFTHEMHFHPKCMDFLLWPAWLYHGVEGQSEENFNDNYERISISFNLGHQNPKPINESDRSFEQLMREHEEEQKDNNNKS